MRSLALIAVVLLSLCYAAFAQRSATARFNSRGIQGFVTFTEEGNENVRVVANLEGLRGQHDWHVHLYPVDQSLKPTEQCLGRQVGPHYNPFMVNITAPDYITNCQGNQTLCEVGDLENKFGSLQVSGQFEGIDTSGQLALTGRYSIIGRPLIIHESDTDPGHLECATIRLNDEMQGAQLMLLQATFISPVAGTIYMRQVERENVEIFGKLYWVDDRASTLQHNWHIHEEQPGEEYRIAYCDITAGGNVGPHFDPTGNGPTSRIDYPTNCTPDMPDGCEVGDLTGKHARIDIPAQPAPYRNGAFFFTDSFLNLTDVVGRSIVVHVPNGGGPALACAPLVLSENITIMASATGFIRASQSTPFEDTIIHTFSELGGEVRTLPNNDVTILSSALNPPTTDCRGDLFTPYPPINEGGMSTPDRYALGDWASRYSDFLVPSTSFQVFDVPLYGANTIVGRTVRTVSGTSRYCSFFSNKFSPTSDNVIRARAVFSGSQFGPIEGTIYFSQRDFGDGILGSTAVLVDIYYAASNLDTSGHNWHVHQTPPVDGMACVDAIGPHYNPFSVSLGTLDADDAEDRSMFSDYGDDCSPTYPLRCESGDLSGKHGQLRISSESASRQTFAYIDPNIQLTGNTSIIGRSIGLHDFPGPLFDCGEVTPIYPSNRIFNIVFTAGDMLRTEFAAALTRGTAVDPVNVIIASQVVTLQFGIECVNVTVVILGTTPEAANAYYDMIVASDNIDDFRCGATTMMVAPMLLVVCLLVAFFGK